MNTIIDYIAWRGDLPFDDFPMNEVDALILSQLSYINYTDIVPKDFGNSIALSQVSSIIEGLDSNDERKKSKKAFNPETFHLLSLAGSSVRYGALELCGFVNQIDSATEEQFAAMTFKWGRKWFFSSFRGTDGSLVGWKENFNMVFLCPVPAQFSSVLYLEEAASFCKGKIFTGGHSKGGNLAIYSAAFCNERVQKRIEAVFNNDGPGFETNVFAKPEFKEVIPKIKTFMPKSSVVGILFEHFEKCVIVESDEIGGILQHDPFSWAVYGTSFVKVSQLTPDSIFLDITVKNWLLQLPHEKRSVFVETLFSVLGATEANSITQLQENWLKKSAAVIKALSKIDPETRDAVLETFHLLLKTARRTVPVVAELIPRRKKD